ncbi:PepSY domain-containing protein [Dyadobacter sp. 3J3]|uniref:PepSY-associated TM helix domain-containing protein n=1 Tax=Dyadobacter sp. 3J3 TaxID=2606600 RepID=UPI001358AC48|nr:PepSY-associated TM helix domain-containing protein [Dyadobacter sp. 3J3]
MKKILKNIAAQLHLWLGISSGLVVFIVALTGSLLVFEEELEPVINKHFNIVAVGEGKQRLSLDSLATSVKQQFPKNKLDRITIEAQEDRTFVFGLKQDKKKQGLLSVAVNPFTGKIIEARQEHDSFFEVVLRLHRYLCMEETGKFITGISCICFLVIMITGLILWWPNRKNQKQRFQVKWGASPKRLNWDLHAVFGFYVMPFIFLIALTGLVWSYKWINNLIYLAFDGKPQQKREAPANIASGDFLTHYEHILQASAKILPHQGKVTFTTLNADSLSITVSKADDEAAISNIVSFLYFDQNTGALLSKRLYDNETAGFKARRVVFPIHTGSLLGWPTKIIAFIVSLITASLPMTGIFIWLGKNRKRKKKAGDIKIKRTSVAATEEKESATRV